MPEIKEEEEEEESIRHRIVEKNVKPLLATKFDIKTWKIINLKEVLHYENIIKIIQGQNPGLCGMNHKS